MGQTCLEDNLSSWQNWPNLSMDWTWYLQVYYPAMENWNGWPRRKLNLNHLIHSQNNLHSCLVLVMGTERATSYWSLFKMQQNNLGSTRRVLQKCHWMVMMVVLPMPMNLDDCQSCTMHAGMWSLAVYSEYPSGWLQILSVIYCHKSAFNFLSTTCIIQDCAELVASSRTNSVMMGEWQNRERLWW